ncbi:sensor histidine kinase [Streptomyces sp. NPDC001020]
MHSEPRPPLAKRLRPAHWGAVDCLTGFLLAALAISALPHLYHSYDPHHRGYPQPSRAALAVAVTTALAVGVAVAVRCPFPRAACAAVLAAWIALLAGAGRYSLATPVGAAVVVAGAMVIYQVAAGQPRRTALTVLGLSLAAALLGVPWGSPELQEGVVLAVIVGLIAWTIGHLVGRNRSYATELREHQAAVLQGELAGERLRIARELHDVIAHSMSVVGVQAGYGHFVIDQNPAQARTALATIQEVSRDSLRELRGLLGVLRAGEAEGLPPAPRLTDLEPLVTRIEEAGVEVSLSIIGERRELPPGIELSAYRILQEALTNVVKHAGPAAVRVEIAYENDQLGIDVTDDGRGGPVGEGGHGLAGMAERVRLYGGRFEAGPLPERGFRVVVALLLAGDRS